MKIVQLILMLFALEASVVGGAVAARAPAATERAMLPPPLLLPHWLPPAEKQALEMVFGRARPVRRYYIFYLHKIAVIFEFAHIVACRKCSGPSNMSVPRGKVIRVSFERRTHRLNGAMQFCEIRGDQPPRALCLRR
jgi:hypothetical protein